MVRSRNGTDSCNFLMTPSCGTGKIIIRDLQGGNMLAAFDIDNVMCDIIAGARTLLSREIGIPVSDVQLTGIYATPFSHHDPAIASILAVDHAFWDREDLLISCPALPGSVEAAWRLFDARRLAAYITRRPPAVEHLTSHWLEKLRFPPLKAYHVGASEAASAFATCKSTVCHEIGVTHLVDDHATEIATAAAAGISVIVVDAEVGRDARYAELQKNPGAVLARDVGHAVDILLSQARAA